MTLKLLRVFTSSFALLWFFLCGNDWRSLLEKSSLCFYGLFRLCGRSKTRFLNCHSTFKSPYQFHRRSQRSSHEHDVSYFVCLKWALGKVSYKRNKVFDLWPVIDQKHCLSSWKCTYLCVCVHASLGVCAVYTVMALDVWSELRPRIDLKMSRLL